MERGRGRTQVKERSTHARHGMHMQQCSAVLTAMPGTALLQAQCASIGRALAATTSGFNTTYTRTSSLSYRSLLRAGTESARDRKGEGRVVAARVTRMGVWNLERTGGATGVGGLRGGGGFCEYSKAARPLREVQPRVA